MRMEPLGHMIKDNRQVPLGNWVLLTPSSRRVKPNRTQYGKGNLIQRAVWGVQTFQKLHTANISSKRITRVWKLQAETGIGTGYKSTSA